MADKTQISWTDATWNPVAGCSKKSEGCRNCYAMRLAATRLRHTAKYEGLAKMTQAGPAWTNEVRCTESDLIQPLGWTKPRRIFVNSMSDTFHEDVPFEFIDLMFAVMALCPHHTFQVLTKRPDRAAEYFNATIDTISFDPLTEGREGVNMSRAEWVGMTLRGGSTRAFWETKTQLDHQNKVGGELQFLAKGWPLPNVWIGTSVENQATADERIPHLLRIPAAARFLSCEPLIGPVDLSHLDVEAAGDPDWCFINALNGDHTDMGRPCPKVPSIHWVICGGESGPGARPMHPSWARSLRDQCAAAGVPFHFKQWGSFGHGAISEGIPVHRTFDSFSQWVSKARAWVGRGKCVDTKGRLLEIGADFERARDERTFPVAVMHGMPSKAAGRLLDGVIHDGFPEVKA